MMQDLASIASRREAAYRSGDDATEELRAATETALETITKLNTTGDADKFQLRCRGALIDLNISITRNDRTHIDAAIRAIVALAHAEQANTSTAKSQRSLISK